MLFRLSKAYDTSVCSVCSQTGLFSGRAGGLHGLAAGPGKVQVSQRSNSKEMEGVVGRITICHPLGNANLRCYRPV